MAKRKVADIIVDTLQAAGVKRCYGVVGDTLNHVTDAIRRSDIAWVHMRHEEHSNSMIEAASTSRHASQSLHATRSVCTESESDPKLRH